jgi:tungstate transport system ATP-binding protein
MLKAKNLCWQQGNKKILDNIDFSLLKGEVIGLVGPNGSGKSSLLKVLSFLEKPTAGEILFQNKVIGSNISLDIRRKIAIVFQDPLLLNTTVYENVASGLKIRGKSKKEISDKVDRWLTSFGIFHLKNQLRPIR